MKKLLITILFLIPTLTTYAAEDGINFIHIEVHLNPDGSANITEIWDIDNVHDGTEYFIGMNLPDTMTVHSLQVQDETGQRFQPKDNWDVGASFQDKAYRSGIISTRNGYELAWGISNFGDRTYTITYTLENLVQAFTDFDGIPGHVFLSPDLSSTPQYVTVTIIAPQPLAPQNAGFEIWGGGTGDFQDGNFILTAQNPDFATIRASFAQGIFQPNITHDLPFHQFPQPNNWPTLLIALLAALAATLFSLAAWSHNRYKLSDGTVVRKPKPSQLKQNQLIPLNGNVPGLFKITGNYQQALGTYLLLWHFDGHIQIDKTHITFLTTPELPPLEDTLYTALKKRANNQNKISAKKVAKWKESSKAYQNWLQQLKNLGQQELLDLGIQQQMPNGKIRYPPTASTT